MYVRARVGSVFEAPPSLPKPSRNLLAVDAVDLEHAKMIAGLHADSEKAGRLVYEMGRS